MGRGVEWVVEVQSPVWAGGVGEIVTGGNTGLGVTRGVSAHAARLICCLFS